MYTLKMTKCLCPLCMEDHIVSIGDVSETNDFKGVEVNYIARYHYCKNADEYYAEEGEIEQNDIAMKDAYRTKMGLLTSKDIISIRQKYGVSQSDFALLLGWGEKTITRYEGHQVQDAAHDSILRKIDGDPEWYLELLEAYKKKLTLASYEKYHNAALSLYEMQRDVYLKKSIQGAYAKYNKPGDWNGFTELDLQKVVDVIRYFSNSTKVKFLYKVKLMKMLWYSDALSYKETNKTITGLVYNALPMGAVPVAYDQLIDLHGVNYEEVDFDEGTGYHFISDGKKEYPSLSEEEKDTLNQIIERFGDSRKKDIVDSMHNEEAYKKTDSLDVIKFSYAKSLSLSNL